MKRKLLAIAGLVIFAALLVSGTLAYFTAEDRAVNVITIGKVDIEIEEYDQENVKIENGVMPESFKNVEPGKRLIKRIEIQNRGDNTAWVRAKIYDKIIASNGTTELADTILQYNVNDLKDNRYKEKYVEGTWTQGKYEGQDDGYWYFSEPLKPGEYAVLFDVVTFDGPGMNNDYQGCTTKIQVIAQATQYEGNQDCKQESWPAEPEYVLGGEQP